MFGFLFAYCTSFVAASSVMFEHQVCQRDDGTDGRKYMNVSNCEFINLYAGDQGGALWCSYNLNNQNYWVTDSKFINCSARVGGCIYFDQQAITIARCFTISCSATEEASFAYFFYWTRIVLNSTHMSLGKCRLASVYYYSLSSMTSNSLLMSDFNATSNHAVNSGSAVYFGSHNSAVIEYCQYVDNQEGNVLFLGSNNQNEEIHHLVIIGYISCLSSQKTGTLIRVEGPYTINYGHFEHSNTQYTVGLSGSGLLTFVNCWFDETISWEGGSSGSTGDNVTVPSLNYPARTCPSISATPLATTKLFTQSNFFTSKRLMVSENLMVSKTLCYSQSFIHSVHLLNSKNFMNSYSFSEEKKYSAIIIHSNQLKLSDLIMKSVDLDKSYLLHPSDGQFTNSQLLTVSQIGRVSIILKDSVELLSKLFINSESLLRSPGHDHSGSLPSELIYSLSGAFTIIEKQESQTSRNANWVPLAIAGIVAFLILAGVLVFILIRHQKLPKSAIIGEELINEVEEENDQATTFTTLDDTHPLWFENPDLDGNDSSSHFSHEMSEELIDGDGIALFDGQAGENVGNSKEEDSDDLDMEDSGVSTEDEKHE